MSGPNSPTAPTAPDGLAERRVQLARVAEDRQERAEGRGAQRDADDDRASSPGAMSQPTPTPTARLMSQPKIAAAPGAAAERGELDLGAGDEEQHREPELRQRRR